MIVISLLLRASRMWQLSEQKHKPEWLRCMLLDNTFNSNSSCLGCSSTSGLLFSLLRWRQEMIHGQLLSCSASFSKHFLALLLQACSCKSCSVSSAILSNKNFDRDFRLHIQEIGIQNLIILSLGSRRGWPNGPSWLCQDGQCPSVSILVRCPSWSPTASIWLTVMCDFRKN